MNNEELPEAPWYRIYCTDGDDPETYGIEVLRVKRIQYRKGTARSYEQTFVKVRTLWELEDLRDRVGGTLVLHPGRKLEIYNDYRE